MKYTEPLFRIRNGTAAKISIQTPDYFMHAVENAEFSDVNNLICITKLTTPIGDMYACANNEGISLLEFTHRKKPEVYNKVGQKEIVSSIIPFTKDNHF